MKIKYLLVASVLFSTAAFADKNEIIDNLSRFFGDIQQENIVKSDFPGVYEVITLNPIRSVLVSATGRYIIQGDVIDLKTRQLIATSARVKAVKQALLNTIKDSDKIIYPADNEKYIVHIFTDVDCPYCRRLHNNITQMNALGITIKYLAAPIGSLHPKARSKMQKIWCAADRKKAMNDYKYDNIIPNSSACEDPVAQQLKISKQLGVNGTPAMFLSDGTHIAGYLPPYKLLEKIQQTFGK
jgi:thiol:disulfide interchange protein DsbC